MHHATATHANPSPLPLTPGVSSYASEHNVTLAEVFEAPIRKYSREKLGFLLADYPLRCLAVSSQIKASMWLRNGIAAFSQATNYKSSCRSQVCMVV